MTLNRKVEELEELLDTLRNRNKANEDAYETMLKEVGEKERIIEDLLGENESLKL